MKNIDVISIIKKENLDEMDYFKALINEGYKNNLLSENDITNIQVQTIELLDKIVYKYNGLESSSIRKEVAEDILNSNIYTISVYLKTFKNPDDAVKVLKERSIEDIYVEGKKNIEKMLNIIRVLYIKVKQNRTNVENTTYDDTILKGIKGFLKIYDADFKAYDMKITADYPLYNNLIGKLEGVEFIKEYLNSINLENTFCNKFSNDKIKKLLYTYSDNYRNLIINIFEIVLFEAIACKLVKRDIQDLIISKYELDKIYLEFTNKSKSEIKEKINTAYMEIKNTLLGNNIELQNYIEKNFDYVVQVIISLLEQKNLDKVFITEKYIEGNL